MCSLLAPAARARPILRHGPEATTLGRPGHSVQRGTRDRGEDRTASPDADLRERGRGPPAPGDERHDSSRAIDLEGPGASARGASMITNRNISGARLLKLKGGVRRGCSAAGRARARERRRRRARPPRISRTSASSTTSAWRCSPRRSRPGRARRGAGAPPPPPAAAALPNRHRGRRLGPEHEAADGARPDAYARRARPPGPR